MFKKLGALLLTIALITQFCIVFAGDSFSEDFEWTDVTSGTSVNGLHGWTINSDATAAATIIDDPYETGNKCINIKEGGSNTKGCTATNSFEAVDSADSNGIINVSFRMREDRDQLYGNFFRVMSSGKNIAIINITYRTAEGTDYYGTSLPYFKNGAAHYALLNTKTISNRYDPNTSLVYPYAVLCDANNKASTAWKYFKLKLNFTTNTLDAYCSNSPITDDAVATCTNFPFIETSTVSAVDKVDIGKGSYRYANTSYDDILISKPSSTPVAGTFAIDSATANYAVNGDSVAVSADVKMPTVGEGSAKVIAAAYNASGELLDVDISFTANQSLLTGGVIPFTSTLAGGTDVSSVKLFLWDSIDTMLPLSGFVDCTQVY